MHTMKNKKGALTLITVKEYLITLKEYYDQDVTACIRVLGTENIPGEHELSDDIKTLSTKSTIDKSYSAKIIIDF